MLRRPERPDGYQGWRLYGLQEPEGLEAEQGCPAEIGRHLPQTVQVVTAQLDTTAAEERPRQVEERGQQLQMMAQREEELERQQLATEWGKWRRRKNSTRR